MNISFEKLDTALVALLKIKSNGIYDIKLILINNASKYSRVEMARKTFNMMVLRLKMENMRFTILDIKKAEIIMKLKPLIIISPEKNLNKTSKYIKLKKVINKANISIF